jgi:cytochrome c-type biogenesis protein CcsB
MPFFWFAFWCYLGGTVAASFYAGLRKPAIRRAVYVLTIVGLASNTVALVVAVAFVTSLLYLIGAPRNFRGLPDGDTLDGVTYRAIGVGFPLFTIGALFAGAVWAQRAWGTPWSWDPKEVSSLIVWLVYAMYLHVRLVRGWRGRRTACLAIVGFALTFFTILGSKVLGGLHSYA